MTRKLPFECDIDFSKEGTQVGYFYIPSPRNSSAWGMIPIPIARFKNGKGKTLLLTGGAHGDEYEGPVALINLINKLKKFEIEGEILIVPGMNIPALAESTRLSPLDGKDLNRSFPGDTSSVTMRIAHFISEALIPHADIVLDFHSGGNSLEFLPCMIMHDLDNKKQRDETLQYLKAFKSPYALILKEIDAIGMLDTYVESLGKVFLTTELGGAGRITPRAYDVAEDGLIRLLTETGNIKNPPQLLEKAASQMFQVPDEKCFVRSHNHGVFRPLYDLGDEVKEGQTVGYIYSLSELNHEPIELKARVSGKIFAIRPRALTGPGDCLFMMAYAY